MFEEDYLLRLWILTLSKTGPELKQPVKGKGEEPIMSCSPFLLRPQINKFKPDTPHGFEKFPINIIGQFFPEVLDMDINVI